MPFKPGEGRPAFNITETQVRYAMENSKSCAEAARFLKISYEAFRKYAIYGSRSILQLCFVREYWDSLTAAACVDAAEMWLEPPMKNSTTPMTNAAVQER